MARIRSIKPGYGTSESISALSLGCELHFAKLWTYADDHGRGLDNARLIKGAIWPLRDEVDVAQVEAWQEELSTAGRIVRYTLDATRYYFEVVNWSEHQHPNRPADSEYPAPPPTSGNEAAVNGHVPDTETSVRAHGVDVAVVVVGEGEVEGEGEGGPVSDAFGADVIRLCDRLADAVESNGSKRPTVSKAWLTECDRMLRIDHRTPEQVERAIDWCQADSFWRSNIMSMDKLRRHFDALRLQAQQERQSKGKRSNLSILRDLAQEETG